MQRHLYEFTGNHAYSCQIGYLRTLHELNLRVIEMRLTAVTVVVLLVVNQTSILD